ncbi:hypothetical protein PspLS_00231 [Pyricularia sp. CBS 133598]|nr:hypothetical protein PspLS_00231 [Pyricularia sp. CBS 133598]
MQFSKIQLFTLLAAVGAMASNVAPVDSLSLPLTEAPSPAEAPSPVDPFAPIKHTKPFTIVSPFRPRKNGTVVAPAPPAKGTDAPAPVDNLTPSITITLPLFGLDADSKKEDAPLDRRLIIKNCEARTTKVECEKPFADCKWLRASAICVFR